MRKITFTLLLTMFAMFMQAQNNDANSLLVNDSSDYKQEAGEHSLELNFNPGNIFGSDNGAQFGLLNGGIKYRHFSSEEKAFRMIVNLSYKNATDIIQQADSDADLLELKSSGSIMGITFMPGIEKHFTGSKKISPYVGMQGMLGYKTTSLSVEYQDNNSIYTETIKNDASGLGEGYMAFGVGLFSGVDYYFVKKLYIGVELGYGLQYSKLLNTTRKDEHDSSSDTEHKNGYSIGASPYLATGNIRLGWTF